MRQAEDFTSYFVYANLVKPEAEKHSLKEDDFEIWISTLFDEVSGFSISLKNGGWFRVYYKKEYIKVNDRLVFNHYNTLIWDESFGNELAKKDYEINVLGDEMKLIFSNWLSSMVNTDWEKIKKENLIEWRKQNPLSNRIGKVFYYLIIFSIIIAAIALATWLGSQNGSYDRLHSRP